MTSASLLEDKAKPPTFIYAIVGKLPQEDVMVILSGLLNVLPNTRSLYLSTNWVDYTINKRDNKLYFGLAYNNVSNRDFEIDERAVSDINDGKKQYTISQIIAFLTKQMSYTKNKRKDIADPLKRQNYIDGYLKLKHISGISTIIKGNTYFIYREKPYVERSERKADITKVEDGFLNTYSPTGFLISRIPLICVPDTASSSSSCNIKHGIEERYFVIPTDWNTASDPKTNICAGYSFWLNNVSVTEKEYRTFLAKEIDRAATLLPELASMISKY